MGSYVCSCPPGYELGPDGNSCEGIYLTSAYFLNTCYTSRFNFPTYPLVMIHLAPVIQKTESYISFESFTAMTQHFKNIYIQYSEL